MKRLPSSASQRLLLSKDSVASEASPQADSLVVTDLVVLALPVVLPLAVYDNRYQKL